MEAKRRPAYLMPALTILAVLSVVVPFLTWRQTWFGRNLSPAEIDRYLNDGERPRRAQHALLQISDRIRRGDNSAGRWYSSVVELGRHSRPEIRSTAAWVMGQDNRSEMFHRALLDLLPDPDLMVRRNAALSLARFADPAGRSELLKALAPEPVAAPAAGVLSLQADAGQDVGTGSLLARVRASGGRETECRSPFAGRVVGVLARDGSSVEAGRQVLLVQAGDDQAWEALRALYLVGAPDDLEEVEHFERSSSGRLQRQAVLTARAIRARSEPNSTR